MVINLDGFNSKDSMNTFHLLYFKNIMRLYENGHEN